MKKSISILLVAAMIGSLAAGCGKSEGGEKKGNTDEKETLTVMCVGTEADANVDDYNAIAEEFSENNEYGVTVEIEYYENEQYKTKLTTLMASNAVPDIFYTWELSYLEPFVQGGKVADITSYLEEDQEWKNSFADGALELLSYDGKYYGIPTQKSLCVMFYNKEIFEEYNIEIPTTYEEFLDVCETLKNNGVVPMSLAGGTYPTSQLVEQIAIGMSGNGLFDDLYDGKEKWNNETFIKASQEVKDMADKGYFQDGYMGATAEEMVNAFINGETAMMFQGVWETDKLAQSEIGENISAFALPPSDPQYQNISLGSVDTSFAIAENSEHKDAAIAFLKYWTSTESEETLLYNAGRIPAGVFDIDETKLDSLTADVLEISNSQENLVPWLDRSFGAGEGVEFNNTCVAILGGEDISTAFDSLQKFADENAER